MENPIDTNESLTTNIKELSATLKRVNTYKFVFFRGVVSGVGTFIGATIVAAIVITFLVQFLGVFGLGDYLQSFLPQDK